MPFMKNGKRDYKREAEWNRQPKEEAQRIERTITRRKSNEAGLTHLHDGMDIDHIKPLSKGGKNVASNERVVPAGVNRSFSRNADGSMRSQTSARERSEHPTTPGVSPTFHKHSR